MIRKQRGSIEPLHEGERGEWKSWLKTKHSKNEDHVKERTLLSLIDA